MPSVKLMIPATMIILVYRMNGGDSEGKCILAWALAPFFVHMKHKYITATLLQEKDDSSLIHSFLLKAIQ